MTKQDQDALHNWVRAQRTGGAFDETAMLSRRNMSMVLYPLMADWSNECPVRLTPASLDAAIDSLCLLAS